MEDTRSQGIPFKKVREVLDKMPWRRWEDSHRCSRALQFLFCFNPPLRRANVAMDQKEHLSEERSGNNNNNKKYTATRNPFGLFKARPGCHLADLMEDKLIRGLRSHSDTGLECSIVANSAFPLPGVQS